MPTSRPVRRTKRVHGIRKQDAGAMAAFAYQQKMNPVEPSGVKVGIVPACTCDGRSVPHIHGAYELERWKRDSSRRMKPREDEF